MRHVRLSVERLYWGVLDASVLARRPSDQQLGFLFEGVLPVAVDDLHAVYRKLPGDERRYLACGIKREDLRALAGDAITLTPESLPPWIDASVEPTELNLLVGTFTPEPVRRLKRWWRIEMVIIVLVCSWLVAAGMQVRTAKLLDEAALLHDARAEVYEQVLEPSETSRQPPELRLLAELRRLRQTRAAPSSEARLEDASVNLVALLNVWPPDARVYAQTEHVTITPDVMTLRAILPGSGEAEEFARHFAAIRNWRLQQPQITGTRHAVQASLRLTRESHEQQGPTP